MSGGFTNLPSLSQDYEHREADQKENEHRARVKVLRSVLIYAHDRGLSGVEAVQLTEMLGLGDQLDDLVDYYPKRQQLLEDIRRQVGLSIEELEDRAAEGNNS